MLMVQQPARQNCPPDTPLKASALVMPYSLVHSHSLSSPQHCLGNTQTPLSALACPIPSLVCPQGALEDQDTGGDPSEESARLEQRRRDGALASTRRAVWADPEDAITEVEVAGRNRLRKLRQSEEEEKLSGEQLYNETTVFPQ